MADLTIPGLSDSGGVTLNDFIPISTSSQTLKASVNQILSKNYMTIQGRLFNNTSQNNSLSLTQDNINTSSRPGYFLLSGTLSATITINPQALYPDIVYSRGLLQLAPTGGSYSNRGRNLFMPLDSNTTYSSVFTIDINNNVSALTYVDGSTTYSLRYNSFVGGVDYLAFERKYALFSWGFFPIA